MSETLKVCQKLAKVRIKVRKNILGAEQIRALIEQTGRAEELYSDAFEARARNSFVERDKNGNGVLDGGELRACVLDLLPAETAELYVDSNSKLERIFF